MIESNTEENEEKNQAREEFDVEKRIHELEKVLDIIIKDVNKTFKKEPKDDITRNEIMKLITDKYGAYFNIDHVDTHFQEDAEMYRRDCFYWLFILSDKERPTIKFTIII